MGLLSTALLKEVYVQIFKRPPYPTYDFTGKTVLVTGANIGLGKEAAGHFVRLGASKVILACRSIEKGEAAIAEIEKLYNRTDVLTVLQLDMSSYASVKSFTETLASKFDRFDHVVLNAGIATEIYEVFEDNESTITVNVVATTYLTLLLEPILRASAEKYNITPIVTVVASSVHAYTSFPERKTPNIFETLNNKKTAVMGDRYQVSKLLQIYAMREIADQTARITPLVALNTLNPGISHTALTRSAVGATKVIMAIMRAIMGWKVEEGSRTLVNAVTSGPESHGVYISQWDLKNKDLSKAVTNEDGQRTQKRVWAELSEKLEKIQPGISHITPVKASS